MNGFASEIANGLIRYVFTHLQKEYLVAETGELNVGSVKVLEKQMTFVKAYFSARYQSNDRKYMISKSAFFSKNP